MIIMIYSRMIFGCMHDEIRYGTYRIKPFLKQYEERTISARPLFLVVSPDFQVVKIHGFKYRTGNGIHGLKGAYRMHCIVI